jgi:glycosyltransferase involved in cell wall biosynthesis
MITVVVPTLNVEKTLTACLNSLRAQETNPDSIIVVDGGSTDYTPVIAQELADRVITTQANRSLQRNIGWQHAHGSAVLFVDADMILDPLVITACQEVFDRDLSTVALVIPETSYGSTFWARVKSFERSFYQGIWWMEATRCIRRDVLEATGGYDQALIGGEDWDLDERIRSYGSIGRIHPRIWHNEQDLTLRQTQSKKAHYASTLQTYANKHPHRARRQLSLVWRVGLFLRRPWQLTSHPILSMGLGIMGGVEWLSHIRSSDSETSHLEKPIS